MTIQTPTPAPAFTRPADSAAHRRNVAIKNLQLLDFDVRFARVGHETSP